MRSKFSRLYSYTSKYYGHKYELTWNQENGTGTSIYREAV